MATIKPLSETVLSAVRSGFIISCLATVVEELIYNSLDAGARKVSVLVGVNNGYIKVEDDGSGINRDGLMLLGERYATSKAHHLNKEDDSVRTFGFRGEVLCSIADISLLEIVTKIQGRPNGYRKVMKGRKCLFLSIDDKQDVGTAVVVRDLFYNQPVRRRQLQSSTKKVLHSVRKCVMRISLVQPMVAFRVVDMESEDELLCTHASPSPLSLLCSNFGIESSTLCKVSVSEGLLKLTGYVSAPSSLPSPKAIQYIYINSRFVVKGRIHKALTCLADMCWDRSRGDKEGKRTQNLASPSYCLNLACPRISYDLNLEVSGTYVEFKDWAPVIRFVEQSVALFWSQKKRKGEFSQSEADEIQTHRVENIVEELSPKKAWQLKGCKNTMKRQKTQNTMDEKSTSKDLLHCKEMQVEDRNSSSVWESSRGSQTKTLLFEEAVSPETETEDPACGTSAGESYGKSLLFDKTHMESDMDFWKRDDICTETYFSHTGWKDERQGEDLGVGSNEVGSGFNFEYMRSHDRNGDDNRRMKVVLESPPWEKTLKRDDFCTETYLSHTEWKDERQSEDLGVESNEVGSVFNFEYMQNSDRNGDDNRHMKVVLESPPWDKTLKTPLNYGRLSGFRIDNIEAESWKSTGSGGVGDLYKDPDVVQMSCRQRDEANMRLLPKPGAESHSWKDHNKLFSPLGLGSSVRQRMHRSENVSDYHSSCFPLNPDQDSAISYPFVNVNDWDPYHHVKDDGFQRISELRNCYGFDLSDDEKEEFCLNPLRDRCIDEDLSYASSPNRRLVFKSGYDLDREGTLESSVDACSFDDTSLTTHGDLLAPERFSPSSDTRLRDPSFDWSPLAPDKRGVQMDLQRGRTLRWHDIPRGRSSTSHHMSCPDSPLFASSDDILMAKTVSPSWDFRSKIDMYGPLADCFSPISGGKDLEIDLPFSQPTETKHRPTKQFEKSFLRTRRSYSATPVYLGKRRFVSVGDYLAPATESPVLQIDSHAPSISERVTLKHTCDSPCPSNEYHQDDETRYEEDPHFSIDQELEGDPMILQNVSSQDVEAGGTGYLKEAQDSQTSGVKWREGCRDIVLKRMVICSNVMDSLDKLKENRILDIQSSMLCLAGNSLVPKSINRNCLESAKVLSQVDHKFIPVVARGILTVIDQHAADERIRLEEMRTKVLSGELMSITYLEEEKELVLPETGYQLLCNYAESIQHWGWICNIFVQESGSFSKNLKFLNDQASHLRLLAVPCILGVKLSDADLQEYLEQLSETDGSSTIPPSVLRVLNYKACRGAIMFGDKLLPSECSLIVEELKRTSLCFQCAHGRPTTVPLVNIKALHKGVAQLSSSSEGTKVTWHGLCRNDINLERAKHRLDVAKGC